MANTLKYIRKLANIQPTPGDKGVRLQVEVCLYDNDLAQVNKSPIRDASGNPLLTASRLITEMLEELVRQHTKRTQSRAA